MASIEECALGVRVKFTDGWGGPASIVGRRCNKRAEGSLATGMLDGMMQRDLSDLVQVRFEAPIRNGPNHNIVGIDCQAEDLTLLEDGKTGEQPAAARVGPGTGVIHDEENPYDPGLELCARDSRLRASPSPP